MWLCAKDKAKQQTNKQTVKRRYIFAKNSIIDI